MTMIDLLKRHEGFVDHVYLCPAGKKTIGYGYNIEANPLELAPDDLRRLRKNGITEQEAEQLLIKQLQRLEHNLAGHLPWWSKLNRVRQCVLLDMAYNLGINGLLQFKKTLALIERGDYRLAAIEMQNSTWANQVKTRVLTLALMMDNGKELPDSTG